ncbi:MAG: gfo/Idh/MocA family oxidoreductase, partial [Planctomycetota bacterium]
DDDATITIEYPDAVAVVQASWNWPMNVKEAQAYCERGDLLTVGDSRLRVQTSDGTDETQRDLPSLAVTEAEPFAHLAAVVRGDCEPNALSSLQNNLVVVEILEAARRSAKTGERVVLEQ